MGVTALHHNQAAHAHHSNIDNCAVVGAVGCLRPPTKLLGGTTAAPYDPSPARRTRRPHRALTVLCGNYCCCFHKHYYSTPKAITTSISKPTRHNRGPPLQQLARTHTAQVKPTEWQMPHLYDAPFLHCPFRTRCVCIQAAETISIGKTPSCCQPADKCIHYKLPRQH